MDGLWNIIVQEGEAKMSDSCAEGESTCRRLVTMFACPMQHVLFVSCSLLTVLRYYKVL